MSTSPQKTHCLCIRKLILCLVLLGKVLYLDPTTYLPYSLSIYVISPTPYLCPTLSIYLTIYFLPPIYLSIYVALVTDLYDHPILLTDACPQQYPSYNWSAWEPAAQTGTMSIAFDIRTISNVQSVNLNITMLSTFVKIKSAFGADVTGGLPGSFYYDGLYAPMDPFFCVDKTALRHQHIMQLTDAQVMTPLSSLSKYIYP